MVLVLGWHSQISPCPLALFARLRVKRNKVKLKGCQKRVNGFGLNATTKASSLGLAVGDALARSKVK